MTAPLDTAGLVERIARAICLSKQGCGDSPSVAAQYVDTFWRDYLQEARIAASAITDALTAKDSELAEARARGDEYERLYRQAHLDYVTAEYKLAVAEEVLWLVQQQCETAVYNITQREHDDAVVRSFQSIADYCARTVLSREASSNE